MRVTVLAGLALLCALSGCEREPRSQAFFEANGAERSEVLADCKAGTHRGTECQLAQLAADTVASNARHSTRRQILQQTYEADPANK